MDLRGAAVFFFKKVGGGEDIAINRTKRTYKWVISYYVVRRVLYYYTLIRTRSGSHVGYGQTRVVGVVGVVVVVIYLYKSPRNRVIYRAPAADALSDSIILLLTRRRREVYNLHTRARAYYNNVVGVSQTCFA